MSLCKASQNSRKYDEQEKAIAYQRSYPKDLDIVCAENLHDAFFKASVSWESKIWGDEH